MGDGYPGAMRREQCAAPAPPQRRQPFSAPPPRQPQPNVHLTSHPPPGATVLSPGDPRIGGLLCWRCGGRGTISFLIFDEEACSVCGGMGRVFN